MLSFILNARCSFFYLDSLPFKLCACELVNLIDGLDYESIPDSAFD